MTVERQTTYTQLVHFLSFLLSFFLSFFLSFLPSFFFFPTFYANKSLMYTLSSSLYLIALYYTVPYRTVWCTALNCPALPCITPIFRTGPGHLCYLVRGQVVRTSFSRWHSAVITEQSRKCISICRLLRRRRRMKILHAEEEEEEEEEEEGAAVSRVLRSDSNSLLSFLPIGDSTPICTVGAQARHSMAPWTLPIGQCPASRTTRTTTKAIPIATISSLFRSICCNIRVLGAISRSSLLAWKKFLRYRTVYQGTASTASTASTTTLHLNIFSSFTFSSTLVYSHSKNLETDPLRCAWM